jgi:DNA-binding transcriptional ArsR family regulator
MTEVMNRVFFICLCLLAVAYVIHMITDRSRKQKVDAVLWVINRSPEGIYALDICDITGVSISTIYIVLARLQDAGAVRYMRDAQWPHRYRYFIANNKRDASC